MIPCLQQVKREIQNQEQTQQVRLPDGMPEIGSVLGAWGQVLLHSKQWQNGQMCISGGVMAWVLYKPEDGSQLQCTDAWIPFQMKWELPQTERDGVMQASCYLRSIDARSISARKLMIRASVGVLGEAWINSEMMLYEPLDLPKDVQIKKNTYPLRLPCEAGEKPFALEETFSLPASMPRMEKLIRYALEPQILEQKVMGGKLVFRGNCNLHVVYIADDGAVYAYDFDMPFSQYSDLDHDYDLDATAQITPVITSIELDADEQARLNLKAAMSAQYVIDSRMMVDVAEDAYSPKREVTVNTCAQQLPMILEQDNKMLCAEKDLQLQLMRVADVCFYPDYPQLQREENQLCAQLSGHFQILYYDLEGALQSAGSRWIDDWQINADEQTNMQVFLTLSSRPNAVIAGTDAELHADMQLHTCAISQAPFETISSLELGEERKPDPNRPSLILRRVGEEKLWDIAKCTGTSVDAIKAANHLADEPAVGQMLLIPIK